MPEFLQQDAELFVSARRQTAFGTPYVLGTDFLRATSQTPVVLVPEMEKTDDSNRSGNPSEFPTTQCNQYWLPPAASFQDQANFNLFGRLGLRAVGAPPLTPVQLVVGVAWQHAANMLSKSVGLQLPTSTVISSLGGASFLLPDCVVDRFRLSQDGVAPVQCQFDLIGSGKHRSPHGVGTAQVETATAAGTVTTAGNVTVVVTAANMPGSPRTLQVPVVISDAPATWAQKVRDALVADPIINAFFAVSGATTSIVLTTRYIVANDATMNISLANGTSAGITNAPTSTDTTPSVVTLPSTPAFACLKPKAFLQYTDLSGLRDLTTSCRVRSWFVEIANNHSPADDRCIGDSVQNAGDYTTSGGASEAAYLSKLTRGVRSISAQIVILLDATMPEWLKMASNEVLTNLTFGARGNILDGAGPTYEALKVIVPNARFSAVQEIDSNGKAALTLTMKAMHDATALGARVEVINGISSNFD
jgi:hypothetical protein